MGQPPSRPAIARSPGSPPSATCSSPRGSRRLQRSFQVTVVEP
jgi:hypothetical protein